MHTTPPSGGGKPPDQAQKKRLTTTHKPQLATPLNSSPAATDFKNGGAVIVAKNRLGSSAKSQLVSVPNLVIPSHRGCSPTQISSTRQISDHSTAGIVDELNTVGDHQLIGHGATGVHISQDQCQSIPIAEEIDTNLSNNNFTEPIAKTV